MMETIQQRRSVRKYSSAPVKQDEIDQLVAAFQAAPCGMHQTDVLQGRVVVDAQLRQRIEQVTDQACYQAPLLFFLLVKENSPFGDRDASAAAENIMLQATDLNLGSVYIMGATGKINANPELLTALQVPDGFKVSTIVAVGHTAEAADQEDRTHRYQCRQI